jgi:predicted TIM-barrel fold metal-dependent hydrolase
LTIAPKSEAASGRAPVWRGAYGWARSQNLVVTTSGNFFMPAFLCTLMALGADNILFSVDVPYESNRIATDWLSHLQITDQDREKICHLNAERVLHI